MIIPFQTIDWSNIEKTIHNGNTGTAVWQTLQYNGLRIRMVEYSANYTADHWCQKGHIVYCLEGSFVSELQNGQSVALRKGMSYIASDDTSTHRSNTEHGAVLLIIDGDFLQSK